MKVVVDTVFPAVQFHMRVLKDDCRALTKKEKKIIKNVKVPFSGLVAIEIFGSRVVITSTIPKKQADEMAGRYAEEIAKALGNE